MKKFKLISLSFIMMLVCGKSISQNVIQKKTYPLPIIQQNKVAIDTSIARLIAYDLVKGDVCRTEIKLVRSNLTLLSKEITLKDSIIKTLNKQKEDLNLIISKKDEIFIKQEEITNTYKKAFSKQKTSTILYVLSVIVMTTTLLLIKL